MSYETLFQNALSLHEAGRLDEAEVLYRQILETAPDQPDVLNLLGLIAQDKGLQEEAVSLFLRAIPQKPEEAAFRYNLAFSYKLAGRYREALEAFDSVLRLRPDIKEAHNEIGLIYQRLGDPTNASSHFQYALDLDAGYAEARINLAMNFRFSNPQRALEELEKLLPKYENEALLWYYLGQFYFDRRNWPKAWGAAAKTKELAPASDEARVLLGQLSLLEKDTAKAKIYFAKAELLNPNNLTALLCLADIYSREETFDEAEKRYRRVLALDPGHFEAHQNYGEMLYRAGRTAEALEEYRQAVILNPRSAEVSNNLAMILKDLQEYKEAAGLLLNAYRLDPTLEEISVNLSETLTLLAADHPEEAKNQLGQWLEVAPDNVFARKLQATFDGKSFDDDALYSEKLFDHFADRYENVMQNLHYSVVEAIRKYVGQGKKTIVDLGCGTGLLGSALKTPQTKLIGVDVSQKMLDKAAEKNVYDELCKDDICHYLQKKPVFDVAVMGDVCGYLRNFESVVKLLKNKTLIFTIEVSDEGEKHASLSGRYRYHPEYIKELLLQNGFKNLSEEKIVLRQENGQDVPGMLFAGS